jgi:hypothetical protein
MKKVEIETLQEQGWNSIRSVAAAIRELTAENPLVLFTKEQAEKEEVEIYDFPYGYNVDKYSTYQQGAVMEVQGDDVKLFLTGDEFGQVWDSELEYIPFECQLQILSYLEERAEA